MTLSVVTQPELKLWLLFRGHELLVSVESSAFPLYPHYDALGFVSDEQHVVGEHEGRPDDARCGCRRSAHARRQPADHAQLLLRGRYARAKQASGGTDGHSGDDQVHRRR